MFTKNRPAAAFVVALIVGLAGVVVAAGPGTPPNIIPYRGHLDIAGAPFNGTTNITFRLYDDADPTQSTLSWSETIAVTVASGGFGVLLGQTSSIPNAALNSADLYLGIEVEGTPLVGTQRISPAPIAVRADRAYALDVETDATVGGQLSASVVSATTLSAPVITASTEVSAPTGNITNLASTNGDIDQLDTDATRATASIVTPYTRAQRIVVRSGSHDAFSTNNAYRNMELRSRSSPAPQSGGFTCSQENEACLACFLDSGGGASVGCSSSASNRNCLCVGPE